MGDLFALAKTYEAMEPAEIRTLLLDPVDEVRLGAVSIMDFQARSKKTSPERRLELYELYMRNHERIDNWSLVDRAAPYVVGGYLWDRSREPLYELARSPRPMERRTAIVATYYFIRQHDLEDTFRIGGDPGPRPGRAGAEGGRRLGPRGRQAGRRATAPVPRRVRGDDAPHGVALCGGAPRCRPSASGTWA